MSRLLSDYAPRLLNRVRAQSGRYFQTEEGLSIDVAFLVTESVNHLEFPGQLPVFDRRNNKNMCLLSSSWHTRKIDYGRTEKCTYD